MKLVKMSPVVAEENPKNIYKLVGEFNNEYGGDDESIMLSQNENDILKMVKLYQSYKDGLDVYWNKYCNGDSNVMEKLFKDAEVEDPEWPSVEDQYNMLEDFYITWFDENGKEFHVEIEK